MCENDLVSFVVVELGCEEKRNLVIFFSESYESEMYSSTDCSIVGHAVEGSVHGVNLSKHPLGRRG